MDEGMVEAVARAMARDDYPAIDEAELADFVDLTWQDYADRVRIALRAVGEAFR